MRRFEEWVNELDVTQLLIWTIVLAGAFEIITLVMRFGAGMESTRHTWFIGYMTLGIRIHHSYLGLVSLMMAGVRPERLLWRNLAIILGGSLVLSDLFHHFCVLWPLTGSAQFDLVYPPGLEPL